MASKRVPPSLTALIPGGGIEAGLQRKFALRGKDAARRQAYDLQQQTDAADSPTQGLHPLASGDVGSEWGPWFEALQENGTTIGGKAKDMEGGDAMPGLHTDLRNIHTVPSLAGLDLKSGRALALQNQNHGSALTAAYDNLPDQQPIDRSALTAINRQRADQIATTRIADQVRKARGY